jgi:hypothetical protein
LLVGGRIYEQSVVVITLGTLLDAAYR